MDASTGRSSRRLPGGAWPPVSRSRSCPYPSTRELSERVKTIFATANATEASATARRMRIDYLYVDAADAHGLPDGVRKFDEHPTLFSREFSSGDVRVYRVH